MLPTVNQFFKVQNYLTLASLLAAVWLWSVQPARAATELTSTEKSIVQICQSSLDKNFSLVTEGCGSGVVISSDGLVITNAHVVVSPDDADKIQTDNVLAIYVNTSQNQPPEIKYLGRLVAVDEDKDIAILKMYDQHKRSVVYPSYSQLENNRQSANNDSITVYGFPDVGGETLTTSRGSIIGQETSGGLNWLKTDALVSFGSSGGAAFNADNKVIGLSTMARSSGLGSVGYLIDIFSVRQWITDHQSNSPTISPLEDRLIKLINRYDLFKTQRKLSFEYPKLAMVVADPDFTVSIEENQLKAESNAQGGGVIIDTKKMAFFDSIDNFDSDLIEGLGLFSSLMTTSFEDTTFHGLQAKKMTLTFLGEKMYGYVFYFREYFVTLVYYYGTGDQDQTSVDAILDSFTLDQNYTQTFTEKTTYTQADPQLVIQTTPNWVFLQQNSKSAPLSGAHKSYPGADLEIDIQKLTMADSQLTNQEFYQTNLTGQFNLGDAGLTMLGLKSKRENIDYQYPIGGQTLDALKVDEVIYLADDESSIKIRARHIYFRREGYLITLSFTNTETDNAKYQAALAAFDALLKNITVAAKSTSTSSQPPSSNTSEFKFVQAPTVLSRDSTSATIQWSTNQATAAGLMYQVGETASYTGDFQAVSSPTISTSHTVTVTGLSPNTTYSYFVVSASSQTETLDSDIYSFRTSAAVPSQPKPDAPVDHQSDQVDLSKIDKNLSARLAGHLLLQAEQGGAIWYVDLLEHKKHLVTWSNALNIFQQYAVGITNQDLSKIVVDSASLDPTQDSDHDGYSDQIELNNHYDPYNPAPVKIQIDSRLGQRLKGQFLLQVEQGGAIWYVDFNGVRHSVRWDNLMNIFRQLALGVTDADLNKITTE